MSLVRFSPASKSNCVDVCQWFDTRSKAAKSCFFCRSNADESNEVTRLGVKDERHFLMNNNALLWTRIIRSFSVGSIVHRMQMKISSVNLVSGVKHVHHLTNSDVVFIGQRERKGFGDDSSLIVARVFVTDEKSFRRARSTKRVRRGLVSSSSSYIDFLVVCRFAASKCRRHTKKEKNVCTDRQWRRVRCECMFRREEEEEDDDDDEQQKQLSLSFSLSRCVFDKERRGSAISSP